MRDLLPPGGLVIAAAFAADWKSGVRTTLPRPDTDRTVLHFGRLLPFRWS